MLLFKLLIMTRFLRVTTHHPLYNVRMFGTRMHIETKVKRRPTLDPYVPKKKERCRKYRSGKEQREKRRVWRYAWSPFRKGGRPGGRMKDLIDSGPKGGFEFVNSLRSLLTSYSQCLNQKFH